MWGELYQRDDDKEEVVKKRLKIYADETKPVLNFYSKRKLLKDLDGSRSINEVQGAVLAIFQVLLTQ